MKWLTHMYTYQISISVQWSKNMTYEKKFIQIVDKNYIWISTMYKYGNLRSFERQNHFKIFKGDQKIMTTSISSKEDMKLFVSHKTLGPQEVSRLPQNYYRTPVSTALKIFAFSSPISFGISTHILRSNSCSNYLFVQSPKTKILQILV